MEAKEKNRYNVLYRRRRSPPKSSGLYTVASIGPDVSANWIRRGRQFEFVDMHDRLYVIKAAFCGFFLSFSSFFLSITSPPFRIHARPHYRMRYDRGKLSQIIFKITFIFFFSSLLFSSGNATTNPSRRLPSDDWLSYIAKTRALCRGIWKISFQTSNRRNVMYYCVTYVYFRSMRVGIKQTRAFIRLKS